jgi:hypothetical protein
VNHALEAIPTWIGGGAGAGAGFFALKWIFEWAGGRVDKREAAAVANAERLDSATQVLIQNLEDRMNSLTDRLDHVETELANCRTQHAQCESELGRLRAIVQGMGESRQQAAVIVAGERVIDRGVAAIKALEDKS